MKYFVSCFLFSFLSIYFALCQNIMDTTYLKCNDLTGSTLYGKVANYFSSSEPLHTNVEFYLFTNVHKEPTKLEFEFEFETSLVNSGFDKSAKTYVLIHGYISGGLIPWVLDLKDRLLYLAQFNIVIVNWRDASWNPNYVELSQNMGHVSRKVVDLFLWLRTVNEKTAGSSDEILWNHLSFVGHSLGAHISGQVAHFLKEDRFWQIERITGLDPAKPCFSNLDDGFRLSKHDASFVDVIHTQIGKEDKPLGSLGWRDPIGHVDFYANGGIKQRGCEKIKNFKYLPPLWKKICSHQYAYLYFIDSLNLSNNCRYSSYEWDGTYEDAERIITDISQNITCSDCPEMGINASMNSPYKLGMFMVVTGKDAPYCEFNEKDLNYVLNILRKLKDPIEDSKNTSFDSI